jgi:hypothetical protein
MSVRRMAVLVAAGMLAVATGVVGCATHRTASADPEKEKLKVKVDVDHTLVEPLTKVKIGGIDADPEGLPACTQNDITGGKCQRLGYPLKKDGSGEFLGKLTREPILILTDVASPGQTCVCYGNRCYCR